MRNLAKKIQNLSCILCIAVMFLSSCGKVHRSYVYKSGKNWVAIRPINFEDAVAKPFNHPRQFTYAELMDLLSSVSYSHTMFVSLAWSKPVSVFNASQKRILAEAFQKAFAEIGADQEIEFSLRGEKRKSRETSGRAFIVGNDLNLVFECIDHPSFWKKEDVNILGQIEWRLVPQGQQRLLAMRSDGKDRQRNWLVIPLEQAVENIENNGEEE